jgi:hypothetical protein
MQHATLSKTIGDLATVFHGAASLKGLEADPEFCGIIAAALDEMTKVLAVCEARLEVEELQRRVAGVKTGEYFVSDADLMAMASLLNQMAVGDIDMSNVVPFPASRRPAFCDGSGGAA